MVTNPAHFAHKWEPHWSPDGSTILFAVDFRELGSSSEPKLRPRDFHQIAGSPATAKTPPVTSTC